MYVIECGLLYGDGVGWSGGREGESQILRFKKKICVGTEGSWEFSLPSPQFCCEP